MSRLQQANAVTQYIIMKMRSVHHLILTSLFIVLSEILTIHLGVKPGILAHISVLILILFQFTFIKNLTIEYTQTLQMMTLIPVYRIITLLIPIGVITYEGYLIAVTISILAGSLVLIARLKLSLKDVGLILRRPQLQILCITAGVGIGYLEWNLVSPSGLESLIAALLILPLSAFADELIFRGMIQQSIEKAAESPVFAILLTSTLYSTFFISYLSAPGLLLVFMTSVLFGYVVSRSGSIIGVSLSHTLINICSLVILPRWF
ncbi:MAG: CPBP family intramembrane glutamic endopeptidase [Methanosarcinales archaeon]